MSSRDNWERLVAAVLKREQLWQLFHQQSRSPSNVSTVSSDDFSEKILKFSSNSLKPISESLSPPLPLRNPSLSQVSNNASEPVTRKLFSAWYRRRKLKDKFSFDIPEDLRIYLEQVRRFSLHELKVATENFRDKIESYYGYNMVYRGQLADGSSVAVKRFQNSGNQSAELQFLKEVEINSIAEHRHVLHMLGVCITPKERMLVYPLLVNGSVESCLKGRHESQPRLNWKMRKKIALGAAKGLAHLHYECDKKIIHHNVNAATVLLDEDFEAVIGDFELAMTMGHNVTFYRSTSIVGTIAYVVAPYYQINGYRWSHRSDVLCYGIFLLELITGQRVFDLARLANDEDVKLLDWVIKRNYKERKWEMLVDADCGGNYMDAVVEQLVQVALLCTQSCPTERPHMSEVVRMLEVGEGLAERWEEWYKKEVEKDNNSSYLHIRKQVNRNAGPTSELFYSWYQRTKSEDEHLVDIFEDLGDHLGRVRRFSLHELQTATENFGNKFVVKDGYNMVYKGWLADGSAVAVKRHNHRGGSQTVEVQFQKEIEISIIAAHPNVLPVLGFCITPKEHLLVYPLMVSGSVESCLRGRHESQPQLNWPKRKRIALGAARGLAYLHYECVMKIIHRDVKAANILLDEDFEAVVGDFDLAIIVEHNFTDFEDAICGTIGHIAPESLSTARFSEKTDVFGYGVFLLELITGQTAFDLARLANGEDMEIRDWVNRNYMERKWEMMVDADCGGNYMEEVVEQLVQIALLCTQFTAEGRPKMSEVVRMLEVGDGLAERWEEWHKKEFENENNSSKNYRNSAWIIGDDISNLAPERLSGPR